MILRRLVLKNWGPYRGEHVLDLAPTTYAVVARSIDDELRSSWRGKSMLMESILFALEGWLAKERALGSDGWIADGEREGGVRAEFDDGFWIDRSRVVGKSERLEASGAKQARAQEEIRARVGMMLSDRTTWFFEQGQMAQLLLAKPEDRMKLVSSWFDLGKLEAAEDIASDRLSAIEREARTTIEQIDSARRLEESVLAGRTTEALKLALADAIRDVDTAKGELALHRVQIEDVRRKLGSKTLLGEYETLLEQGREVRTRIDGADGEGIEEASARIDKKRKAAVAELSKRAEELRTVRVVARGEFDGRCPVAEIECPARKKINEDRVAALSRERVMFTAKTAAEQTHDQIESVWRELEARRQELARDRERLAVMKRRALEIKDAAEAARSLPASLGLEEMKEEERRLEGRFDDARARETILRNDLSVVEHERAKREALAGAAAGFESRMRVAREGVAIFGRNGAQRRVAERALSKIERGANKCLAACDPQLRVEARWAREGSGSAKTCEACGRAFPRSERVKKCEGCGATRGANVIAKLDFPMTAESGGARDLVGVALNLAAGDWLRKNRGSPWDVVVLDEPTGQLDAALRRGFVARLPAMIRAAGASQAFVISHDTGAIASLPGRIEIVSDGRFSTVSVAA